MTLEQFIEQASESVGEIFRQTGQILPMYHFVCRSGEEVAMAPPHRDKDLSVIMVRSLFELRDVVRYVFMDEAWVVVSESAETQKSAVELARQSRLSEHPNRVEIVMLQGEDEREGMISGRRDIIRGKGKPKLGPLRIERFKDSCGRMVGLLPKRGTTH